MNIKIICLLLAITATNGFASQGKPALPWYNPYWAESSPYPVSHTTADFSPLAGPNSQTKRLADTEVQWKPTGLINGYAPMYSSAYPNGKRVMWIGGHDRISKLDAATLETLSTYKLDNKPYLSDAEIHQHIEAMDKTDAKELVDYSMNLMADGFGSTSSVYRLLSKQNELYIPHRYDSGQISLRVYGDADAKDPSSDIVLKREWKIPAKVSGSRIMSVNMLPDGKVVMATQDGVVIVLSQDFSEESILKLPRQGVEETNQDFFAAFMRNGLSIDDRGGIYVVSRDYMHRIQWTGNKLSMDEADGAWSVTYANEVGVGSGTSPGLMGWGDQEDHLVIIADGSKGNNAIVYWRDDIPQDWKGLPNMQRRIAGMTKINYGVSKDEVVQVENAPIVYGHGAFFNNTFPVKRQPDQGSPHKQWLVESMNMQVPGYEAKGGAMIHWNQEKRILETAWKSQTNFVSTVCTVSGVTELVYCWGARNEEWTLEATDWHTGESKFHYVLGKSHRYNPLGGPIIINRDGGIDCGCAGGLGIVRIQPQALK